jgi:hypothetical protein
MYSPGDDQIAFSSNGVRSLLVGSSGGFTVGPESGSVQVSHTIYGYSNLLTWGNGTLNLSNRNGSNAITIVMANSTTKFASWSSSNTFPWSVQDSSGNDLGYVSSSGAWTLGPSGHTGAHTINGNGNSIVTTAGNNLILKKSSGAALMWQDDASVSGTANCSIDNSSGLMRFYNHGGTVNGSISQAGAWTLGPSVMYAGIGTQNDPSVGFGIVDSVVNVTGYSGFTGSNTGRQGGVFRMDTRDDSSQPLFSWYARAPGVALGTLTMIGRATNSGAWTLGPTASTATNCAVNGAASVTHGVIFPASQNAVANANTLDDYEEGTFTPNFLWGGAASGIDYGNRVATYSKIGNRVFFHMYVGYTARGSSPGDFTITGLPFTSVATASGGHSAVAIWFSNVSLTNYVITGYVGQSSTTIFLNASPINTPAGSTIALSNTAFPANNGGFMITGHYITA